MERRKRVIGWPERVSSADPETYIAATDNIGALGELINLSGKMRMLSHRAILFVALERFEQVFSSCLIAECFDSLPCIVKIPYPILYVL